MLNRPPGTIMLEIRPHYLSVLVFNVKSEDFERLSEEAATFARRKAPTVKGLLESIVLGNDARTELLLVSQWASRNDWSVAQWDNDVGQFVTTLVESAKSYEIRSYEPITVLRTPGL
jgi:hypothetical protein